MRVGELVPPVTGGGFGTQVTWPPAPHQGNSEELALPSPGKSGRAGPGGMGAELGDNQFNNHLGSDPGL